MASTRVYREASESIKMGGGEEGGGGCKKPCGFIGAHKQAAGKGKYGRQSIAISITPSFLFKHKTWSRVAAHDSGRGFTGEVSSISSNSARLCRTKQRMSAFQTLLFAL